MGLEERIKNMEALTLSFTNDIREEAINQIYSTLIKVFNNVDSLIAIINSETDTFEYINPAGIEHDIAAGTNIRHMIGSSCEVICKEINLPIKCEDCPLRDADPPCRPIHNTNVRIRKLHNIVEDELEKTRARMKEKRENNKE